TARSHIHRETHLGRPGHSDGRVAAALLASGWSFFGREFRTPSNSGAGGEFNSLPRWRGPSRPSLSALHTSRRITLLWARRGRRYPLLLSWLEIHGGWPVYRPTMR